MFEGCRLARDDISNEQDDHSFHHGKCLTMHGSIVSACHSVDLHPWVKLVLVHCIG